MIPCKKCLVLPICKRRNFVKCDQLYRWVIERKDPIRTFKVVRSVFRNGIKVKCSDELTEFINNNPKRTKNFKSMQSKLFARGMREAKRESKK